MDKTLCKSMDSSFCKSVMCITRKSIHSSRDKSLPFFTVEVVQWNQFASMFWLVTLENGVMVGSASASVAGRSALTATIVDQSS